MPLWIGTLSVSTFVPSVVWSSVLDFQLDLRCSRQVTILTSSNSYGTDKDFLIINKRCEKISLFGVYLITDHRINYMLALTAYSTFSTSFLLEFDEVVLLLVLARFWILFCWIYIRYVVSAVSWIRENWIGSYCKFLMYASKFFLTKNYEHRSIMQVSNYEAPELL